MKNKRIIKENFAFQEVIEKKKSFKNQSFVIYVSDSEKGFLEYGISVGKKIGNAVVRNKIKRQIRMMFKEIICTYGDKNKQVIVLARKSYLDKNYQDNLNNLNALISKL